MKKIFLWVIIGLFIVSFTASISAEDFGYNLLEPGEDLQPDTNYSKVSVNSSRWWDTLDHGPLNMVSMIQGSWIGNDLNWISSAAANGTFLKLIGGTMTGDINMNNNSLTEVESIQFDLTGNLPVEEGIMQWDSNDGTLAIGLAGGEVNLQVGQEQLTKVRNNLGFQVDNGKVVYISGALGEVPTIGLADVMDSDTINILGVTTENISDNSNGFVTRTGLVRDFDTTGTPVGEIWTEGDTLYLDEAGNMSNTHPTAANGATILVGVVIKASEEEGVILVNPELFTLGNNFAGTLRQTIINKNETGAVGFTAVNDLGYFTTFGIASSENAGFGNSTSVYYAPGYGEHWTAVDGNKSMKWYIDREDRHNNGALDYLLMELNPLGELILDKALKINGFTITEQSSNPNVADNFSVIKFNRSGDEMSVIGFQGGGAGQANWMGGSLMLVNRNGTILNGVNASDCQTQADNEGVTLNVDCNSTDINNPLGTGPDLVIFGDSQVSGEVWARDTDQEWHFTSRELEIRDELYNNIVESPINSSYDTSTAILTINESQDKNIFINIEEVNYDLGFTGDSITLTEGTNDTPIQNSVYYSNGGSPALTTSVEFPDNVAQVAQMLLGDGIDYGSIVGSATNNEFIRGTYNRWFQQGASYESGFGINVTIDEVNISTGTMWVLLDQATTDQNHSTSELALEIHSDGDFHQHVNNLSAFDTYATGEAVGTNKYFNLVCGIAITENDDGQMYCIVQNKPLSEYTTKTGAELDNTYVSFFPANSFIKKIYIPIVRVVIQAKPAGYEIQTLSNGELFFDLRGTVTGAGAAPTAGVTALSQLEIDTNLDMQHPTTSVLQNITNVNWGFFEYLNISGSIIGPGSNFAQYQFGANNFNGSGNFTTTGNITADIFFGKIGTSLSKAIGFFTNITYDWANNIKMNATTDADNDTMNIYTNGYEGTSKANTTKIRLADGDVSLSPKYPTHFRMHGEENGLMSIVTDSGQQWSVGNGATGVANGVAVCDGEFYKITLSCKTSTSTANTVNLSIGADGSSLSLSSCGVSSVGSNGFTNSADCNAGSATFQEDDYLTFDTTISDGNANICTVFAYARCY